MTVIEKENTQKIKMIFLLVFALFVAFITYFFIVDYFCDNYINKYSDLGRSEAIFDFYLSNYSCDKIYYWGSSSIKEDLIIDFSDSSYCHFNLGNPASTPLRRFVELDYALKSEPYAIIFSVGPMSFSGNWIFPYDQYALISSYLDIKGDWPYYNLFNYTVVDLVNMNSLDLLIYKRKFIRSAFLKLLIEFKHKFFWGKPIYYYDNYNTNFTGGSLSTQITETHSLGFNESLYEKSDFSEYEFPDYNNSEIIAFEHIVSELKANNFSVIILKVPINPLLLEEIPFEELEEYNEYLLGFGNKFNITILDYQDNYNSSLFYDGHHLNLDGAKLFSHDLISNVEERVGQ